MAKTLAVNTFINGKWYGPSYGNADKAPDHVDLPSPDGKEMWEVPLPESAFDPRAHWPNAEEAARHKVDWPGPDRPEPTDLIGPEDETPPERKPRGARGGG